MSKIGDLFVKLGLKKDGFDRGMQQAQTRVKSFGTSTGKALAGVAAKFASITMAVKALGGAVKNIAGFERANATLASVLGTTIDGVKDLSQSAKELGRTSEFTASNVTELQTALARLGFNKQQILDMQGAVLKFASAVGTDLGSAADFTGSALRAFGLQAEDTQQLLDIMAKSTSASALDFSKLQTSISVVAPIAKSFGLSVNQTAAFLGVLANNGFDASSAATALRNILLNLADGNGKLSKGLGHSAKNFDEIIEAFKELSRKGVDVNSILQMTDKRSAAAAAALIANGQAVKDLDTQLSNADGTLDQMYETMTNNVIGAVRNLKSAWEGLTLAFQNSTGPMKSVVDWMTKMVNKLTDFYTAAQTGGKSAGDKKEENALWERFKYIGDNQGKDAMVRQFNQWLKDAEAAYDRAIDAYNAHKTRKNKKAMNEAGDVVMNLYDIAGRVRTYEPGKKKAGGKPGGSTNPMAAGLEPTEEEQNALDAADNFGRRRNEILEKRYKEYLALYEKFGKDTSELTRRYYDLLLGGENGVSVDEPEFILDNIDWDQYGKKAEKALNDYIANRKKNQEEIKRLNEEFNGAIAGGFAAGMQVMMDALMSGEKMNGGQILQGFLEPLADMAIREGEIVLAGGLAIEAFKESLESLNGPAAIAAGAGLIAAGAAVKAGLASLASNGGNSSAGTNYVGSAATSQVQNMEMTVYVKGKLSGSDIVISGQKTINSWNR